MRRMTRTYLIIPAAAPENPASGVAALAARFTTVRRAAPGRAGFRAATRLAQDYEIGCSVVLPDPDPGLRAVEPASLYPAMAASGWSFRVAT
jgi:hypothetical protein